MFLNLFKEKKEKEDGAHYGQLYQSYSDSLHSQEKILAAHRIIVSERLKETTNQVEQYSESYALLESEHKNIEFKYNLLFLLTLALIFSIVFITFLYRKNVSDKTQEIVNKVDEGQLKNKFLQEKLEEQSKEMALFTLNMIQKEELFKALKKNLILISKKQPENIEIRRLMNKLNISDLVSKDWSFFTNNFNKAFPSFLDKLRKRYPDLTRKEIQHCILIKLNTSSVESANILGISTQSVHTARYRLRKKLNLRQDQTLEEGIFIL